MPAEPQVDILKVAQEAREQAESLNADPDATLSVIAGVVWHHPDGRMAKLKRRDFPAAHRG